MIAALKFVGAPGSAGFLVLCGGVGLFMIYVWPRRPILGRAWLLVVCSAYLLLATPVVAHDIADALTQYRPVPELARLRPVGVIVTLDGDNVRGRVRETVRAAAAWPATRIVLFGDDRILERLLEAGVSVDRITHDPRPPNTLEQMVAVRNYLTGHAGAGAAVVASRFQMPRIAAFAETMRLRVTLLPSSADVEPPRTGFGRWLPAYAALRISSDALYEHAALVYYRWKI